MGGGRHGGATPDAQAQPWRPKRAPARRPDGDIDFVNSRAIGLLNTGGPHSEQLIQPSRDRPHVLWQMPASGHADLQRHDKLETCPHAAGRPCAPNLGLAGHFWFVLFGCVLGSLGAGTAAMPERDCREATKQAFREIVFIGSVVFLLPAAPY